MQDKGKLDWSRAEKLVVQGDIQSLFQAELNDFITAATQPRATAPQPSLEKLESMWIRTKYDAEGEALSLREAPLILQVSDVLRPVFLSPADLGLAPPDPALGPVAAVSDQAALDESHNMLQLLRENRLLPLRWLEAAPRYSAERWAQFLSLAPAFRSLDPGAELMARLLRAVRGTTLGDYALSHLLPIYVTTAQEIAAAPPPSKGSEGTAARPPVIAIPPVLKALLTELVRYSSLASSSALEVSSRIEKLQLRQCGPLGVKVEMELAAAYFILRTQAPS